MDSIKEDRHTPKNCPSIENTTEKDTASMGQSKQITLMSQCEARVKSLMDEEVGRSTQKERSTKERKYEWQGEDRRHFSMNQRMAHESQNAGKREDIMGASLSEERDSDLHAGDSMPEKPPNTIQIYSQNVNGISLTNTEEDFHHMVELMKM